MYCPKCQKLLSSDSQFCTSCGYQIQNSIPVNQHSMPQYSYEVLQVVLKEKLIGTGSGNLMQLQKVINNQAARGYRLHTCTTASSGSTGFLSGDRIQATLIFEKIS